MTAHHGIESADVGERCGYDFPHIYEKRPHPTLKYADVAICRNCGKPKYHTPEAQAKTDE